MVLKKCMRQELELNALLFDIRAAVKLHATKFPGAVSHKLKERHRPSGSGGRAEHHLQ